MNCPNCGTQLPDGTPACPACGTQFAPAPMQQPAYDPYGQAPVAQKKSNTGLIVGIIIAVIAIAAAIVLVVVLKNKKSGASDEYNGTYYLTSMSDGYTTYSVEDFKAFGYDMSGVGLKISGSKIDFVGGEALGMGSFVSSEVEISDGTITIKDPDGTTMTGTISGNKISITSDGITMVFEK